MYCGACPALACAFYQTFLESFVFMTVVTLSLMTAAAEADIICEVGVTG